MKYQVLVRLKPGVLDVQGKAIQQGLSEPGVSDIRVGRLIELEVESGDAKAAKTKVEDLCNRVLINPIIECCEIKEVA